MQNLDLLAINALLITVLLLNARYIVLPALGEAMLTESMPKDRPAGMFDLLVAGITAFAVMMSFIAIMLQAGKYLVLLAIGVAAVAVLASSPNVLEAVLTMTGGVFAGCNILFIILRTQASRLAEMMN